MSKRIKRAAVAVAILVVLLISAAFFKINKDGFKLLTYTTDNLLGKQLEDIISKEEGQDYNNKIVSLGEKEFNGGRLVFYKINKSEKGEYLISEYDNKGSFGNHKIFNLKRVLKGDNSVVMIGINDGNRNKYFILSALDNKNYAAIKILNKTSDEVLDEISLEDDDIKRYEIQELNDEVRVLEYIPKSHIDIKLEVTKKSGN